MSFLATLKFTNKKNSKHFGNSKEIDIFKVKKFFILSFFIFKNFYISENLQSYKIFLKCLPIKLLIQIL